AFSRSPPAYCPQAAPSLALFTGHATASAAVPAGNRHAAAGVCGRRICGTVAGRRGCIRPSGRTSAGGCARRLTISQSRDSVVELVTAFNSGGAPGAPPCLVTGSSLMAGSGVNNFPLFAISVVCCSAKRLMIEIFFRASEGRYCWRYVYARNSRLPLYFIKL